MPAPQPFVGAGHARDFEGHARNFEPEVIVFFAGMARSCDES